MSKIIIKKFLMIVSAVVIGLAFLSCDNQSHRGPFVPRHSSDLMLNVSASNINAISLTNNFIHSKADFSFDLFHQMLSSSQNTMISGSSILIALAMMANGASGDTLNQIERAISDNISIANLNRYLHSFANNLHSFNRSQLEIANSIWFRQGAIDVHQSFLQSTLDYFNAHAYASAFNQNTAKDINNWVNHHTDGMIERIINQIPFDAVMMLFNAIMFDSEWAVGYLYEDILQNRVFVDYRGQEQRVTLMQSIEKQFLSCDYASGFIKPYYGGHYSFVALLPNEGVCVIEYARGLTGTGFLRMLDNAQNYATRVKLPKFEFRNNFDIVGVLYNLGITDLFCWDSADLSRMGTVDAGTLFVNEAVHSTFIEVNEKGTRAAAVTGFMVACSDGPSGWFDKEVILNRPFAFAIVDNTTNLPIFKGTVLNV